MKLVNQKRNYNGDYRYSAISWTQIHASQCKESNRLLDSCCRNVPNLCRFASL